MKILFVCIGNICCLLFVDGYVCYFVEWVGKDWFIDLVGIGGWYVGEVFDV